MDTPEATAALTAAQLVRALAGGPTPAPGWSGMPRPELLATHRQLAAARRRIDAALAGASAELARRSSDAAGAGDLARREGFATPAALVAASTGGSRAEAARLIQAGRAGGAPTGGEGVDREGKADGAEYRARHVARALAAGTISVDAAAAIAAMLERVHASLSAEAEPDATLEQRLEAAERRLVDKAPRMAFERLAAAVRQAEARLNVAAQELRLAAAREARYLRVYENRDGVVVVDGKLDPETAAPLRAALDDIVSQALRRKRDDAGPLADDRTALQMRADALADIARHAIGCDSGQALAPTTTVVVRMGLDELRGGAGLAAIDGHDAPVDAGAARRMAAAADVIPAVLGGDSEVLDFGRARRLFTRAQRRALVERDGGCARCHAPPSWTEVHHIRWWERDAGPTDLSNGVLLCTACHHRVHRDGWGIEVRKRSGRETVWFVPPAFIDPERRPVLGGRAQFEYSEAA